MEEHKVNRVIFASQDSNMLEASFTFQALAMLNLLDPFNDWIVHIKEPEMNRGAHLIAHSVT